MRTLSCGRVIQRAPHNFAAKNLDQIAAAARVAPLVVVPREHLHAIRADDARVAGINDRRMRIAPEIDRDQFLFGVIEDALHRAFGGALQRSVYGFHGRGLLGDHGEIHHADVRRRHAHGVAVELALQLGNHEVAAPSLRRWKSESSKVRRHGRGADPCAANRAASGRSCRSESWSSCRP